MARNALFDLLYRRLHELRTANGANVTVIFALATVPMIGFVGAAVDYSHANKVKAAMQAAADSTALMLSKSASSLTSTQLTQKANEYFAALFTRSDATGLAVSANYSNSGGSQVTVNASANVKTNFMQLMGYSNLRIGVDSQAKWGTTRLRVALALDTTGSMADAGKMTAMKAATKNLLDQLKAAASSNGDIYVSIIPFSKDVNVGKSNYNASWIDWSDWNEENGYDYSTTTCTSSWGRRRRCTTSTTWVTDNHNTWNGCVMDRGEENNPNVGDYDTNVVAPTTSNKATLFAAEQYENCSPQMKPLSYDWTGMKTLVDSFYPDGTTNQNIGLAHAWMSLVGGGPYPTPPAEDANYKYQKVIILMTDGLNTENRWYNNANQIDHRQKKTCDNAKAAGITIYTVHVNTDGDPLSTLLQGCASAPDKFWMLTSASALNTTFNTIGSQLTQLRIAQ
jgi:Flp pilus assembly protein TadG